MMSGSTKYSLPNSLWTWAHLIMIVTSWHERWLAPDWYHKTVGCHRTLCWHLIFIYYMVSRSRRWQRRSKESLVKSIPSLPSAVPTTKQRVRWLTTDQHLITNCANHCNSDIRLVQIPFLAVLSTALIPFSALLNVNSYTLVMQCRVMWEQSTHQSNWIQCTIQLIYSNLLVNNKS